MRACLEAFKVAVRVRHLYKRAGSRQLKLSIYQLYTLQCIGLKLRGQTPDQRETSHRCIECTQKDVEAIVNRLAILLRYRIVPSKRRSWTTMGGVFQGQKAK